MSIKELAEEIEMLREQMVQFYLKDDVQNAVKTSQHLDQKIYDYLVLTQKKAQ